MGQIVPLSTTGQPLGEPYPAQLSADGDAFESFQFRWPQIGTLVVRASVRDRVRYLDEELIAAEDLDWLLRIAVRHRVGHVAVPGVLFRERPVATRFEDQANLLRVRAARRVFWRNVWRARHRRLPILRVVRAALRFDGAHAGYFLRRPVAHARAGDPAAALRSLLHAGSASARARSGAGTTAAMGRPLLMPFRPAIPAR